MRRELKKRPSRSKPLSLHSEPVPSGEHARVEEHSRVEAHSHLHSALLQLAPHAVREKLVLAQEAEEEDTPDRSRGLASASRQGRPGAGVRVPEGTRVRRSA